MKESCCRCRCRRPERNEWNGELQRLGCSEEMIQTFMNLLDAGRISKAQKLLSRQRQPLLHALHQTQEQIDHLDVLLYALNQDRPS